MEGPGAPVVSFFVPEIAVLPVEMPPGPEGFCGHCGHQFEFVAKTVSGKLLYFWCLTCDMPELKGKHTK